MGGVDPDIDFMRMALAEARAAFDEGEVPVGAVIVTKGTVVASSRNNRESCFDPTGHAEIGAIRSVSRLLRTWRLSDAVLYVTKEPCVMCAGAIVNARIGRLVYGCKDPKGGAVESLYAIPTDKRLNHRLEVRAGVLADECAELLRSFFRSRRKTARGNS